MGLNLEGNIKFISITNISDLKRNAPYLNSAATGARKTSGGTTLLTLTLCSAVPWYLFAAFSPSFWPGLVSASLTIMTRGTLAFGAIDVKRLLVAREVSAFLKAVRVPCEVKMLGRSSTRISFRRLRGVEAEVEALGTVKPFKVDDCDLFTDSGVAVEALELALGTAILLSAVRTPKRNEVDRVAFARNEGNWFAKVSAKIKQNFQEMLRYLL